MSSAPPGASIVDASSRDTTAWRSFWKSGATALWSALAFAIVALAAWTTRQRLTWYIATMQFAMLTSARDLVHGSVFHHSPALDALRDLLPLRTDTFAQTYVWDHGRLYSRYAPGFPILLAIATAIGGEDTAPYVSGIIFLMILMLLIAMGRRLLGSRWLAAAVPALVVLLPTRARWWALTPTHDMAAHFFGLLGVYLALRCDVRHPLLRAAGSGLALGFAVSVRPDAALYLLPAAGVAVVRPGAGQRWRGVMVAALGVVIGTAPLLAYDWLATGSPFRPTQSMELTAFWTSVPTALDIVSMERVPASPSCRSGMWCSGIVTQVQGGGLRLANLARVLPQNVSVLRAHYGDALLGAAATGMLLTLALRPLLFVTTVGYLAPALIFFSCWVRTDARLLLGIDLLLPMLVLQGTVGAVDLVGSVGARRRYAGSRVAALALGGAFAIALMLIGEPQMAAVSGVDLASWTSPALARLLFLAALLAMVGSLGWEPRTASNVAAATLVVCLVAMTIQQPGLYRRAPFQRAEVERDRQVIESAVDPTAVIITTENIGRPAENLEYYAGVPALYLTDLARWRLDLVDASRALIDHGLTPYLLIDDHEPDSNRLLTDLSGALGCELVRTIPPSHGMEYFVASPMQTQFALELYRIGHDPPACQIARRGNGPQQPADARNVL